jgi:hypothetical protein
MIFLAMTFTYQSEMLWFLRPFTHVTSWGLLMLIASITSIIFLIPVLFLLIQISSIRHKPLPFLLSPLLVLEAATHPND